MTKTEWSLRFQAWSNNMSQRESEQHYGKCGYGCMCDNCDGDFNNLACVTALTDMLQQHGKTLNYEDERNLDFAKVFDGEMYVLPIKKSGGE